MRFQIDHKVQRKRTNPGRILFFVLLILANPAVANYAELTNLVVRNSADQLQICLRVEGIFTEELKAVISKGIPIGLTFLVCLFEVHDNWFDDKLISKTTVHDIKFDVLKREYRIHRSWEKRMPRVMKDFENARSLFSEIENLDVIPLIKLKKGTQYQLRVKSEVTKKKVHFTGFPWEFETDWYTINFIY